jgi:hypothetical protein
VFLRRKHEDAGRHFGCGAAYLGKINAERKIQKIRNAETGKLAHNKDATHATFLG